MESGITKTYHSSMHIISYNMHGLNQGGPLLLDLCNNNISNVVFIQEHWMSPANINKILNFHCGYTGFGVSAMENAISHSVLRGRSYGGSAILVQNDYLSNCACIQAAERFVIVSIGKTLFINVYFPCSGAANSDNIVDSILTEIGSIITLYCSYSIVMGGDINSDLSINSKRSRILRAFMKDFNLSLACDILKPNCRYTYFHETQQHFSTVDYFMISNDVASQSDSLQFSILDDMLNLSDHLPVSLHVSLPVIQSVPAPSQAGAAPVQASAPQPTRLRWDKANIADYYAMSYIRLQPLVRQIDEFNELYLTTLCKVYFNINNEPVLLRGQLVDIRPVALNLIETIYNELTLSLIETADESIPKIEKNALKHWWNDNLNDLKTQAIQSNKLWIEAGKPNIGLLASVRKNDKYAYKLAIRKYKTAETSGITNALYESFLNKDSNTFWQVWRSKMGTVRALPKCVNGLCTASDIAESFADHFSAACNKNSEARSNKLQSEFLNRMQLIDKSDNLLNALLSVELVDLSLTKLKSGKAAGVDRLTAEHLKNAHPIIVQLLTKLLNIMILFEYVPDGFGIGIMVPIPKGQLGKSNVNCDDFRGISINPIISKLFECCLLSKFSEFLETSDLQFGFKANSSCSKALYSVRKTIEYFTERQSTVSLCALDLSKAFDKMNRNALFIKLLDRNCPVILINILDCWFSKTYACVKWGDSISSRVKLNCGTRQGGILSPTLFSVFINDVILRLQKSSLGCHIRNLCLNAFMYADDLLLMSISICDLQDMIIICKSEFDWLDMAVNIKKSACIRVGSRFNVALQDPILNDNPISWCNELCYLGIVIKAASTFRCNLHSSKVKFFRSLNGILGKLGTSPQINLTLSLIETFCNPVLLYGLESLHLTKSDISLLSFPYNSVYMKLFATFDKSILTLCQFYCGQLPLAYIVDLRTLNFYADLCVTRSLANVLYKWFGEAERAVIAARYNIVNTDSLGMYRHKVSETFKISVSALL